MGKVVNTLFLFFSRADITLILGPTPSKGEFLKSSRTSVPCLILRVNPPEGSRTEALLASLGAIKTSSGSITTRRRMIAFLNLVKRLIFRSCSTLLKKYKRETIAPSQTDRLKDNAKIIIPEKKAAMADLSY